jgi:hypothetical protein
MSFDMRVSFGDDTTNNTECHHVKPTIHNTDELGLLVRACSTMPDA